MEDTSVWDNISDFLFGKKALQKAVGMDTPQPSSPQNTDYVQKQVQEYMRQKNAIGTPTTPVTPKKSQNKPPKAQDILAAPSKKSL